MSKIIEKKSVMKEIEIVKGIQCDVCKKKIIGKYWVLTTHHHDWGNDSIESFEYTDVCSEECINHELNEYLKRCEDSKTQSFELNQRYFRGND